MIIANLGLILTNRSWTRTVWQTLRTPNTALWWVIGGASIFLGLVLYVPFLRGLFQFDYVAPLSLLLCLAAGIFSVLWFEVFKIVLARRSARTQSVVSKT